MNQEKIGKFIAQCRKNKNLTQSEFAQKLGVTNKTVSRWENGHYLPDISLFEDICLILDIEISELLHGEKIKNNIDKKEVDNTIKNLVKISDKKTKKKSKTIILISIAIMLIMVIVFGIIIYKTGIKNKNNNDDSNNIYYDERYHKISIPTQYAYKENENGWVCHMTIDYDKRDMSIPSGYWYECDNLKYKYLEEFDVYNYSHGQGCDDDNGFCNHPKYLFSEEYYSDVVLISKYFTSKKFNDVITIENLSELNLTKIKKEDVLDLYNKAIKSDIYDDLGKYRYTPWTEALFTTQINKDESWQIGYMLCSGHIEYVTIDLKIGDEYLSDIVKSGKATTEQKNIYENMNIIKNYILENQLFKLPEDLSTKKPYTYLIDVINKINDGEKTHPNDDVLLRD